MLWQQSRLYDGNHNCKMFIHPCKIPCRIVHTIILKALTTCISFIADVLYMHRTCSDRLNDFRIMMIDGVCRSEREGHGYLCMCGRHLCNSAESDHTARKLYILLSAILMVVSLTRGMPLSL
jgi:hypothetical protein